ncbi:ribonuclease BN [Arthrobacter sp. ERGS1:01]|uniref:YihY/virulence factor BrkB family protein n=1 Tax=Arthrobacter sp. ERGS1:01 TaxID=1704044 RepID=UPI0006B496DF|nr:YihY/virulence factor BrkB family protein [Arthrobacter sp. ERGS1:01]ALE06224.1 ribonuclease BN [Arthrobacter sp. ERGS1:01]
MAKEKNHVPSELEHESGLPGDDPKPGTPVDTHLSKWRYVAKRTVREFTKDACPDMAAALTYHGVLSIFPAMLALVSLLGLVGQGERTTATLLDAVRNVAPDSVAVLKGPIEQMTHANGAGFAFAAGIVVALLSASGYVGSFGRAMNRIYEIDEGRPAWKLRPVMLLVTLVAVLLVALMVLMLVLSGPVAQAVGDAAGMGGTTVAIWNVAKWPVIAILAIVVIALLFHATPNVRQPKFRWISLGSVISLVVFVVISVGFGFYVANFAHYNKTYGTIGGAIVLLLWLWILNMSLLFGAEFDAELERGRELVAGIAAEETIQLPPRDSKGSVKRLWKDAEEISVGRRLRSQRKAAPADPSDPER